MKDKLIAGMIIQDSTEEYGIIVDMHSEKFIAYKDSFQPLSYFNDELIGEKYSIDMICELDDYVTLKDLYNIERLDEKDKLTYIWSRY